MTGNHACPVTAQGEPAYGPVKSCDPLFKALTDRITANLSVACYCTVHMRIFPAGWIPGKLLSTLIVFFYLIKASSPFNKTLSSFSSLTRNLETGFMFSWNRMFYVPDFFVLLSLMSYLKACLFKIEKYKQLRSLLKQRNEDQTSYNLKIT